MVVMTGVAGPYAGAQFTLTDGDYIVGRNPSSQVQLTADPAVSGSHLRLTVSGISVRYQDLGSRNGTFVNSQRAQTGIVSPRDRLQVGSSVFVFQPAAPTAATLPPTAQAYGAPPPIPAPAGAQPSTSASSDPPCPRCGGTRLIWRRSDRNTVFWIGCLLFPLLLLAWPFLKPARWECLNCGFQWRP
jgi:hypothetical protein